MGQNEHSGRKAGSRSEGPERQQRAWPLVAALDVGTTKIACLAGYPGEDGGLGSVTGLGTAPAAGMHKGVVVDIGDAAASIESAVEQAAAAAGADIPDVFVGVAGSHIVSMNRKVVITNPNADGRVTSAERRALLKKLRENEVSPELQLIHALPREYILDGQDGIKRPVGMWAKKIGMAGHLVYGAINSIQNLITAVNTAGLEVDDIVLEPLASSRACLEEQEMNSGVMLVDIGGGTTDVAMFHDGRLVHTGVLPVGGNHLTRDISVGLKVPLAAAESIKLQYGHAVSHLVEDIEMVRAEIGDSSAGGGRTVTFSQKYLARIIEARINEIFTLVMSQAQDSGYLSSVAAGIVVTGGTSQLEGICDAARHVTGLPVRQGAPLVASTLVDIPSNPVYATAVGLLQHGCERVHARGPVEAPEVSSKSLGMLEEVLARVKGWFRKRYKT